MLMRLDLQNPEIRQVIEARAALCRKALRDAAQWRIENADRVRATSAEYRKLLKARLQPGYIEPVVTHKECSKCGAEKELREFSKHGRGAWCKKCCCAVEAARASVDPDGWR